MFTSLPTDLNFTVKAKFYLILRITLWLPFISPATQEIPSQRHSHCQHQTQDDNEDKNDDEDMKDEAFRVTLKYGAGVIWLIL
jgi:hypothetical protein